MSASLWVALCTLLLALALYVSGALPENQEAYTFPNLVAIVMCLLAVTLLISEWKNRHQKSSTPPAPLSWSRLITALLIIVVYLYVVDILGFYITSWLAFLCLASLFAPEVQSLSTLVKPLLISFAFIGVLYSVFALLLQVQTPRGLLF